MTTAHHFIGNQWVAPSSGGTIAVINPSTGLEFARIARGNAADIDAAVKAARKAFDTTWRRVGPVERGRILARLGQLERLLGEHSNTGAKQISPSGT